MLEAIFKTDFVKIPFRFTRHKKNIKIENEAKRNPIFTSFYDNDIVRKRKISGGF